MPKCSYCTKNYEPPRGLTLVLNSGRVIYLCSSKCRKNRIMKRRKVRWITKSKESKAQIKIRDEARIESQKKRDSKKA